MFGTLRIFTCINRGLSKRSKSLYSFATIISNNLGQKHYSKFTAGREAALPLGIYPLCEDRALDLISNLKETELAAIKLALKKYEAKKQKETFEVFFVNAVPFVGFGFLDNFTMIVAGDYIEHIFGTFMCISTMAAAGFGNTISDVLGIGSAHYVERGCELLGLRPPDLTPVQMEMKSSRRSANFGRILGITVGCLIGMCPLLFMENKDDKDEDKNKNQNENKEQQNLKTK
ncbi:transmembrane protein 65 isoform X3 [Glossina fuscipes]|uniref:Transmembrane protein 65 isoform X3 n=1 Tax=Glossina fuscipes TaxID=7396 RepID=A0A8U0WBL9_9MUSC|nr:transmembrane protein 65 isoform X3 [Glossina fuscipes]